MKFRLGIKRRWLRISVRTMLLIMLGLCIGLAYWSNRTRRQEELVRRLVNEGRGLVAYHHEFDETGKGIPDARPPGPGWLRRLLGDHAFMRFYYVGTYKVTEDDLRLIAQFPSIEKLSLDAGLRDEGMTYIAPLRSLKRLELESPHISDRGIENLAGLRKLEELVIMNARLTDDGLKHLGNLTSLKLLLIDQTQVTAEGVAWLRKRLPNVTIPVEGFASAPEERQVVRQLIQNGGRFSADKDGWITNVMFYGKGAGDEDLSVLLSLKRLEALTLLDTRVTFAGVDRLRQTHPKVQVFPSFQQPLPEEANAIAVLNELGARLFFGPQGHVIAVESFDVDLSEELLRPLGELPRLTRVTLWLRRIGEVGCRNLARADSLEVLWIPYTEVNDAGLRELTTLSKLKELWASGANISRDGFAHLGKLPALKALRLTSVGAGGFGLDQLKNVSELTLSFAPFTSADEAFIQLSDLQNVRVLRIHYAQATDDSIQYLQSLANLDEISLQESDVTDDGLLQLAQLPNLKQIDVKRTRVTSDGVARFLIERPACKVTH